ncbi:MAG: LPS export ABC transporter periplasmic protein LptC [Bacteroidales bacterium]
MKLFRSIPNRIKIVVSAFAGATLLYACNPDTEAIQYFSDKKSIPGITAYNSEVLYTEDGKAKIKVFAPVTIHYQFSEEPYTDFPEGITVYTYDDTLGVESTLTAKQAVFFDKKNLWQAKNNVVAKNRKGEVLNTEELFWDQKKKIIYSNVNVKINSVNGVMFGRGLTSDETFDHWEIKQPYDGEFTVN